MKTLLVMRHAKSSWAQADLSDFDRPLNKRGKRDAPRMGRFLRDEDLVPDLIVTSSAKRALSTAEAFAQASDYDQEVQYTRLLYHAYPDDYYELLRTIKGTYQCVMVIGHNPGMEALVEELTGLWERMPTAAIAQIQLPIADWQELNEATKGDLIDLWRPKELGQ